MPKSGYLARQEAKRNAEANAFEAVTRQLMVDTLQITLHKHFGFGFDRILKASLAWHEIYNHYYDVMDLKNPECDVLRAHLDEELRDIIKDRQRFADFDERYPEIKRVTYEGRRRR